MTIFLRQKWTDNRLKWTDSHLSNDSVITLDTRMANVLWVPDLFFPNEKRAHLHEVTVPNRLVRIHSNGTILYSSR